MKTMIERWRQGLKLTCRPDEFETKQLLSHCGIAVPDGMVLAPGQTVVAPAFDGPYVLKVCSPDVLHKTDCQGVRLHLSDADLAEAVADMRTRFSGMALLIEQQLTFSDPEMIAGALIDPTFGPAVMVGVGGVLTELYKDVAFRLAPFDAAEARRMLGDLKVAALFDGYRSMALDTDALAATLASISQLVDCLGTDLDQLDINPMVFAHGKWTALDAALLLNG